MALLPPGVTQSSQFINTSALPEVGLSATSRKRGKANSPLELGRGEDGTVWRSCPTAPLKVSHTGGHSSTKVIKPLPGPASATPHPPSRSGCPSLGETPFSAAPPGLSSASGLITNAAKMAFCPGLRIHEGLPILTRDQSSESECTPSCHRNMLTALTDVFHKTFNMFPISGPPQLQHPRN